MLSDAMRRGFLLTSAGLAVALVTGHLITGGPRAEQLRYSWRTTSATTGLARSLERAPGFPAQARQPASWRPVCTARQVGGSDDDPTPEVMYAWVLCAEGDRVFSAPVVARWSPAFEYAFPVGNGDGFPRTLRRTFGDALAGATNPAHVPDFDELAAEVAKG